MGGSSDSTSNTASNTASNQATNFASQGAQASASNTQQNYAQNSASNTGPVQAALDLINKNTGPISSEAISGYMSPYLQQVIDSTVGQQQQNNAVQQQTLKGNAISQNALGGDRSRVAQAELMRGQGLNDASTIANLYNTGYGQALSAAQQDRAANLQAAGMMGTQQTGSTAGTSASATSGLSETAMQGAQAASGTGASSGQTNSTTSQGMGAGQMAGLAMSAMMLMSDERVKVDKRVIGESFDGQKIYSFRYKGDPKTHIGFMAQEVEKEHPEAVGSLAGLKMVNYDEATRKSADRGHFADGGAARGYADGGMTLSPPSGFGTMPVFNIPSQQPQAPGSKTASSEPSMQEMYKLGKQARAGLSSMINKMNSGEGQGGSELDGYGAGASTDVASNMPVDSSAAAGAASSGSGGKGSTGGAEMAAGSEAGGAAGKGSMGGFADGGTPSPTVSAPASAAMPSVAMPTLSSPTVSLPTMYAPTVGSSSGGGKGSMGGGQDSTGAGKGSQGASGATHGYYPEGAMVGPTVSMPNVPQVSVPQAQAADSGGKGSGGAVRGYADGGGTEIDFSQLGLDDTGGIPADSPYIMDEAKRAAQQQAGLGALKDADFSQAWRENPTERPATMGERFAGYGDAQPSDRGQADVKAPGISVSPTERAPTLRETVAGMTSSPMPSPDVPQMDAGQSNSLAGLAALNAPETPLNPADISTDVVRNDKGGLAALGNMPPLQETQVPEVPATAQAEVTAKAPAVGGKQAVVQTIIDEMRASGASDSAIRGLLANVKDESAFNPTLRHFDQPSSRFRGTEAQNAHGLYQEGGDEWNKYAGWLKENHPDANWQDPGLQTKFLAENLQQNYPKVWKTMNEGTPEEAAQAFVSGYLKPAKRHEMARSSQYASGVPEIDDFVAGAVGKIKSGAGALAQGAQDAGESISEGLGGLSKGIRKAVTKGFESDSADHPYKDKADKETGGFLKQLFGVEFNPLGLTEKQRMTMLHVGASLASNGNVGQGIQAGLNYQTGLDKESRQATLDAMKLNMEFAKLAQPVVIGETVDPATGATRKQYGSYDMASKQFVPVTPGTTAGAAGAPQANYLAPEMSAEDAVKAAPPAIATMAKKYANYELPAPSTARQNPQMVASLALAEKINPGFSQQEYKARQALKTSFTSGKDADEVKSYSTVMHHVESADASVDAMGNTRSSLVNAPMNAVRGQISPSFIKAKAAAVTGIDTAISEYNRATSGKPITVDERQNWRTQLSENTSPEGMHATYKSFMEYIAGRMTETANKYNTGMGIKPGDAGYKTPETMLSPVALKEYQKLSGTEAADAKSEGDLQAARPTGVSRVEQARQQMQNTSTAPQRTPAASPITATGRNGERYILQGNQWVQQ
jgi:hypothetical protein